MNTKMKVLSLAIVGLVGFAGSALAACPAGPTTAEGGAWTNKVVSSGSHLAISSPGLDTSTCKMGADIAASLTGTSLVTYVHAASEPSYRFQFLVNPDALGAFSLTDNVTAFRGVSTTTAHGLGYGVQVLITPGSGGTRRLRFIAACSNAASNYRCSVATTTNLPAGNVRIEGNLKFGAGAAGKLDVFVNAAAGASEPTPTVSIPNLDNTEWGGISQVFMGLVAPNVPFKNAHAGQVVNFDTFDSRRNTYIGS